MSDDKIYTGANGDKLNEADFIEQAEAMPSARRYLARGHDYNVNAMKYYMKHGSPRLRKQLGERMRNERRTLSPKSLEELSALGKKFDVEWLGLA